mgnify:CR=1 FL=1
MQMMLRKGLFVDYDTHINAYDITKYYSVKIFEEKTVELFTTVATGLPYRNSRALGWDTNPYWQYPCPCG